MQVLIWTMDKDCISFQLTCENVLSKDQQSQTNVTPWLHAIVTVYGRLIMPAYMQCHVWNNGFSSVQIV